MIPGSPDPKSSQAQPSWVVGPSVPAASRLGQVIEGEFLIKGVLGQGELGVTYEAENARLKRKFAVLMLKRELKPTHEMMLAVRNDLRRAQQLGAAGLMPVKMLADRDGIPGFATELLEGETLRARLNRGPLRAERALAMISSIARTLDAAHKVGLVHGDLRPENIFLVRPTAKNSSAGKVMVVEHAMHHLRRRAAGLDDRLPLYKHLYRPPEQVAGMIGATEKGDVFVLGAILHECLTARPAFFAEEIEFILENLASPPPPLRANPATGLSPELAAALTLLIRHACALQLDERVPTMAELIEGIEQIVQGYKIKLPEVPVESKDEVTAPPQPASAASETMSRLLQRMSGVFPQIALPPTGIPAAPASDPAPAPSSDASGTGQSAAVRISSDAAASIPRLEPLQQERVSRILRKLSGAFPVIAPPPADAPVQGSTDEASPPVPVPASDVKHAAIAAEEPPKARTVDAPAGPGLAPSAATPVPTPMPTPVADSAPRFVPAPAPETIPTDPKAAMPSLAELAPAASTSGTGPQMGSPLAASVGPTSTASPTAPPDSDALSRAASPAEPRSTTDEAPAAKGGTAQPGSLAASSSSSEALAGDAPALSRDASDASALPPLPTVQPITAPLSPSPGLASDEVREAPVAGPANPVLPPTLVVASSGLPAETDALPPPSLTPEIPTRPRLEVSTELAVPPMVVGGAPPPLLPAPVVLLPPRPAGSAGAAGSSAVSPFQSGAIAAVAPPLASAPTAVQIPRPGRLQHETTLAGDDLAVILEPSSPSLPVPPPLPAPAGLAVPPTPKPQEAPNLGTSAGASSAAATGDIGAFSTVAQIAAIAAPVTDPSAKFTPDALPSAGPRTVSELATRPAFAALADKLAPLPQTPKLNDLPTQPAVRRLPITELATQARIPAASASAADGVDAVPSSNLEDAPPPVPSLALSSPGPTAGPAAATIASPGPVASALPVAAVAPVVPSPDAAAPSRQPALPVAAVPAAQPLPVAVPPAVGGERAPAPRPPRVSQLIAALQNQQGPLRPPPEPEPVAAPVVPPSASGPKATGAQARGLMAPVAEALAPLPVTDPQLSAGLSQPTAAPVAQPGSSPQPATAIERVLEWAMHHQELAAAGLGALLVLLLTLFYLALMR